MLSLVSGKGIRPSRESSEIEEKRGEYMYKVADSKKCYKRSTGKSKNK